MGRVLKDLGYCEEKDVCERTQYSVVIEGIRSICAYRWNEFLEILDRHAQTGDANIHSHWHSRSLLRRRPDVDVQISFERSLSLLLITVGSNDKVTVEALHARLRECFRAINPFQLNSATSHTGRLKDTVLPIHNHENPVSPLTISRRFDVALSFPGERREFVEAVADHLATKLGKERILYDKFHEAELARPDLDVYLPRLYREQAALIIVFLCPDYAAKRWCRLEWRHVRQSFCTADAERIMFVSFGNPGDLSDLGILRGDGYLDIGSRSPVEIANEVRKRLVMNQGLKG